MDFQKAINSAGEVLYEYVTSIIFIPKTLFKILLKPTWIPGYLTSQNGKVKIKYEKYSNPLLFWIVIGIIPYYFLLQYFFSSVVEDKELQKAYFEISIFSMVGGLSMFLVSFPLSCAFILHMFKGVGLTTSNFKRSFYIQLYITAPVLAFYIPLFFIDYIDNDLWLLLATFVGLGVLLWFLIAEFKVIRKELESGIIKAIFILVLMYGAFFVFAFICLVLYVMVNLGTFYKMVEIVIPDPTKH